MYICKNVDMYVYFICILKYVCMYVCTYMYVYACVRCVVAVAAAAEKLVVPAARNGACLDSESLGSGDSRD